LPKEERYGLTSQKRRSLVSIPSNIAKGYGRKKITGYITKQTLESMTPGILGPSSPTKLEKNYILKLIEILCNYYQKNGQTEEDNYERTRNRTTS